MIMTLRRAATTTTRRRGLSAAAGPRRLLPSFSTVALGATAAVVGGGLAYDRWKTKMHQSSIAWHGADRGARPPTEQIFVRGEIAGEAPELRRIWRQTCDDGFEREGDGKTSGEGQQPTV